METTEKMALSVAEAARQLGVSRPKIYELMRTPGFPACRIGGRTLVNRLRLQEWLDAQCAIGGSDGK